MSKIFSSPKKLVVLIIIVAVFGVSVAGGALGAPFGLGFVGAPIANIQLPAEKAFSIGAYEVKNSSIMLWFAGIILVALAYFATRKIRSGSPDGDVPTGLQNFFEVVIEFFVNLGEQAAGGRAGRRFLPLVVTIFLVVVMANWVSVLPGVGTIGWVENADEFLEEREEAIHEAELKGESPDLDDPDLVVFTGGGNFKWIPFGRTSQDNVPLDALSRAEDGHTVLLDVTRLDEDFSSGLLEELQSEGIDPEDIGILVPYLRGANTDVNMTLSIAIVSMIAIQIWGFRSLGFRGYAGKFINVKQGPIFFAVGLLEIIGEIARLISFTFRLFGNMFAGEVLLVAMAFLFPLIGTIPFIGLELFVGLIQAFIFAMLTLVFGVMATVGHGEEAH